MHSTLKYLSGFAGLYVLAYRETGRRIGISLWQSAAALHAWEQMRGGIVPNRPAAAGRAEQEGASYEVVFSSYADPTSAVPLTGAVH